MPSDQGGLQTDERIPVRALERSKIEYLIRLLRESGSGRAYARTIVGIPAAYALDAAFRLERLLNWYDYHSNAIAAVRAEGEAAGTAKERERCAKRLRDERLRGMHNDDVRTGLAIGEQAIRDMKEPT